MDKTDKILKQLASLSERIDRIEQAMCKSQDRLVTTDEAAELLATSKIDVQRMLRTGELPYVSKTKSYRISYNAIQDYINERH